MRIPFQLIPQGVIPRDPNLTFRVRRAPESASATSTAAETPTTVLDFLLAHFDGQDNIADYHAERGALVAVNVSFQDAGIFLEGAPTAVYAPIDTGGWQLKDDGASHNTIAFRSGVPPTTPDYLAEAQIEMDPATDLVNVHMLMRCSRIDGDAVEWQGVGMKYLLGDQGSGPAAQPAYEDSVDYSGSNTSGDPVVLDSGTQTITLRTEVQDNTIRAYINGALAMSQDFSDPALVDAGDLVFAFEFGSSPDGGGLYPGKILDMRARVL